MLTGCGMPINRRAIAKTITVEKSNSKYEVGVYFLITTDSSDKPEPYYVTGEGKTLSLAFAKTESTAATEVFYAQNEILLLSDNLSRKDVEETIEYFSDESFSRANMSVLSYKSESKFNAKILEEETKWLEKLMSDTDDYVPRLYGLNKSKDYIIPYYKVYKYGSKITEMRILGKNGKTKKIMDKYTQLVSVIMGTRDEFELEIDGEIYVANNLSISNDVEDNNGQLVQCVTLRGKFDTAAKDTEDKKIIQKANEQIVKEFSNIYNLYCDELSTDIFEFDWWYENYDKKLFKNNSDTKIIFKSILTK